MAYENGSNIFNYTSDIFEKYKYDNMIFIKALQTIQIYQNRADYPYCLEEMNNTLSRILGGSFETFIYHNYIFGNIENETDINPKSVYVPDGDTFVNLIQEYDENEGKILTQKYVDDVLAFAVTVRYMSDLYFDNVAIGMGIKTIAYNKSYGSVRNIKIIRNDNQSLEMSLDKEQIHFIIKELSSVFDEDKE